MDLACTEDSQLSLLQVLLTAPEAEQLVERIKSHSLAEARALVVWPDAESSSSYCSDQKQVSALPAGWDRLMAATAQLPGQAQLAGQLQ